jgi:hypothetical protein
MRFSQIGLIASALLLASSVPASATPKLRRGPTSPRIAKEKPPTPKPKPSAQGISPERATQIQTALIKAGYMTGTPSGTWDAATQAAMEKLQADNGWQTKLVPDARAIIKLGLGSSVSSSNSVTETPATSGSNQ